MVQQEYAIANVINTFLLERKVFINNTGPLSLSNSISVVYGCQFINVHDGAIFVSGKSFSLYQSLFQQCCGNSDRPAGLGHDARDGTYSYQNGNCYIGCQSIYVNTNYEVSQLSNNFC